MRKLLLIALLMFIACISVNATTTMMPCYMWSSHVGIFQQNGNYTTFHCSFPWCGSWYEKYYNQGCPNCYTNNLIRSYYDARIATGWRLVTISSQCIACMYYTHPISYFYVG